MGDEQYVEIVSKVRLWASIADDERVTAKDIEDRYTLTSYGPYGSAHAESTIKAYQDILNSPKCEVATRWLDVVSGGKKWGPCRNPVAAGEVRCKNHGGPSAREAPSSRVAELEAEIQRLRDGIEEIAKTFDGLMSFEGGGTEDQLRALLGDA